MLSRDIWIHLTNFGLFVFIWTIQLVVYPSFRYFPAESLLKWHGVYTGAVTVIVMPLMIAQVALHGLRLFDGFSAWNLCSFLLVASTWVVTFFLFVPLHNKISLDQNMAQSVVSLVSYNWIRTALWSLIFFVGLGSKA